jgi:predicted DNA-binding protein (UPF0251 family)
LTRRAASVIAEIAELNQIRLDEDLTLEQLAGEIGDIDASTLSRLFDDAERKPLDRTLHKIRRFLDDRKTAAAAPAGKRKRA